MSENFYVVKYIHSNLNSYGTHFIVKAKNKKETIDLIFAKEFHSRNLLAKQQEVKPIRKCDLLTYQILHTNQRLADQVF